MPLMPYSSFVSEEWITWFVDAAHHNIEKKYQKSRVFRIAIQVHIEGTEKVQVARFCQTLKIIAQSPHLYEPQTMPSCRFLDHGVSAQSTPVGLSHAATAKLGRPY